MISCWMVYSVKASVFDTVSILEWDSVLLEKETLNSDGKQHFHQYK